MAITITETRKSWIWFEAYGEPLAASAPTSCLASCLAWQGKYEELLRKTDDGFGRLSLPWPAGSGMFNNFWRRYLEGVPGEDATACWKHLMPLRLAIPMKAGGANGDGLRVDSTDLSCERSTLEVFLYPHGAGLVVTLYLLRQAGPAEITDAMRQCFDTVALNLLDDHERRGPFKLSLLPDPLFDLLRKRTDAPSPAEYRGGPFSVATVIQGEIGKGEDTVEPDSPLHRALEGLCTGDPYWADTAARPLEPPHLLDTRRGPAQHLLLADDASRAVWFPKAFGASTKKRSKLGCYHRNLTLLSLQVESLLGLAHLAHHDLATQHRVRSGRLEDLARLAVQHLGRLYGRNNSTYRSASAPAQIDAGERKAVVDEVRRLLGIGPPLFR